MPKGILNKLSTILIAALLIAAGTPLAYGMEPSDDTLYSGIDVSKWQGFINFEQVKAAGVEFVYIRSSAGSSYIDPYFSQNYEAAKAQGLKVGFYHYVYARSVSEAVEEAEHFIETIEGTEPDLRLAVDFESFGTLAAAEVNEMTLAFLERAEELSGLDMVVYSNTNNAANYFDNEVAAYPLWVAQYGSDEPDDNGTWDEWVGFQYSDTGSISGISGNVDLDWFTEGILLNSEDSTGDEGDSPSEENGSDDASEGGGVSSDEESGIGEGSSEENGRGDENSSNGGLSNYKYLFTRSIIVQDGDTLWDISLRYNSNIDTLAQLNSLENPDLIYPGQVVLVPVPDNSFTYVVESGDTLTDIAERFNRSVNCLVDINDIENPDMIYAGQLLFVK